MILRKRLSNGETTTKDYLTDMSIRKGKNQTRHGLERAKSRVGIANKHQAIVTIRNASKKGLNIADIEDGALKEYLKSKDHGKRVKLYKRYVYIFNKTSDRVITIYPLPDEYLEEYKKYGKQ